MLGNQATKCIRERFNLDKNPYFDRDLMKLTCNYTLIDRAAYTSLEAKVGQGLVEALRNFPPFQIKAACTFTLYYMFLFLH